MASDRTAFQEVVAPSDQSVFRCGDQVRVAAEIQTRDYNDETNRSRRRLAGKTGVVINVFTTCFQVRSGAVEAPFDHDELTPVKVDDDVPSTYRYTQDELRLKSILSDLPGTGARQILTHLLDKIGKGPDGQPAPVTTASIADFMIEYRDHVKRMFRNGDEDKAELDRLKADVAAVRRLFGTS